MRTQLIALCILPLSAAVIFAADLTPPAIIPAPQKLETHEGTFALTSRTRLCSDKTSRETAEYLANRLSKSTGYPLKVQDRSDGASLKGAILLTTAGAKADDGPEGYKLSVTPNAVVIRASQPAGLFYGAQTLLQLLPPEIFASQVIKGVQWRMPCVEIQDQPRFQWRGVMLDVSRHFFTKEEVKRLLDEMALYKLNTFHWHLVDDQGWRIEIKAFPKLTEVGAWRKGTGFGMEPKASTAYSADGKYGGFYTQNDIREVVAYATARHITIVPEIEMPGHSSAALSAYPQFSCTGGPFEPPLVGGVFNGIYCAGNDETFKFLEAVLTEVFQLFPSRYVHIGGDEVPTNNWTNCPKCQATMEREGLKQPSELEGYFIRRMEKFINAQGKNLIGWSEIREGGLAPNAAIMDWVGGAVEAANAGHDVVMSPLADCYFDHYQSRDHTHEPHSIGGYLPLQQVYAFEPVPEKLSPENRAHILGAQANLWTEYVPNFRHVEYMLFPRLCALAEVTWSPRATRNWADFERRLPLEFSRLDALDVNYRHMTVPVAEAETHH